MAETRQEAASAVAQTADVARTVLGEINKVKKENADLLAEVAELTNGGPA